MLERLQEHFAQNFMETTDKVFAGALYVSESLTKQNTRLKNECTASNKIVDDKYVTNLRLLDAAIRKSKQGLPTLTLDSIKSAHEKAKEEATQKKTISFPAIFENWLQPEQWYPKIQTTQMYGLGCPPMFEEVAGTSCCLYKPSLLMFSKRVDAELSPPTSKGKIMSDTEWLIIGTSDQTVVSEVTLKDGKQALIDGPGEKLKSLNAQSLLYVLQFQLLFAQTHKQNACNEMSVFAFDGLGPENRSLLTGSKTCQSLYDFMYYRVVFLFGTSGRKISQGRGSGMEQVDVLLNFKELLQLKINEINEKNEENMDNNRLIRRWALVLHSNALREAIYRFLRCIRMKCVDLRHSFFCPQNRRILTLNWSVINVMPF